MGYEYLKRNLEDVQNRIRKACNAVGRNESEVVLLAATKYATPDEILELQRLGVCDFGENRVQQLMEHQEKVQDSLSARMHFIGQLQRNKVKYIIDKVCMIHSLDSLELAEEIERQAKKRDLEMDVLVEINSGRELSKGGVLPEDTAAFCKRLSTYPHLHLKGFMTMAPKLENPSSYYEYFSETYNLCIDIWHEKLHNNIIPIISMGMSTSFETAIQCGSTLVRVGHDLFKKD